MSEPRPAWVFHEREPWIKHRDPVQGEFFATDAIADVTDALVREAVQNSLDADDGDRVVRVRFSLGEIEGEVAERYLAGLWEHVEASDEDAIGDLRGAACRFLAVEDFDTTGLRGDPSQMFEIEGQDPPNDFFYFFRAEGKSGKSGADRGRWGVGKYVFPMASRLNAFFALTVRTSDTEPGPLLMGQAVLRNHELGGKHYPPDGWFALASDSGPLAAGDEIVVDEFACDWGLDRGDQNGLSVVIPHVAIEATGITLSKALVRDYYGAILSNNLSAQVVDGSDVEEISAASFDTVFAALDGATQVALSPFVELYRFGLTVPDSDRIELERPDGKPEWKPELLSEEDRDRLRLALLEHGGKAMVRVPVLVAPQWSGEGEWTWFDVVLGANQSAGTRAHFLREGIRVTEVDSGLLQGIEALVLVEDRPLARMLGDAEGPAHTTWSPRTAKFVGRYAYGQTWISFVRRAPKEILRLIRGEDEEEDRTLAASFFSIPGSGPTGGAKEKERDNGKPPKPTPPPGSGHHPRVVALTNGFSVSLPEDQEPDRVTVEMGYDVRRGNPLTRWRPEDFTAEGLTLEIDGGTIETADGNMIEATVGDPASFRLKATGFDPKRDLFVVARSSETDE